MENLQQSQMGLIYEDNDTIGYFSSNRNGVDRIYKFITKPTGKVFIDGIVLGPDGNPLEGATVKLMDAKTGEVLEELITGADAKFDRSGYGRTESDYGRTANPPPG